MNQAAVFPSLTDSTVVSEVPAKSPPQKTLGSLLCIVSGLMSGSPDSLNFSGDMASFTSKSYNPEPNADMIKSTFNLVTCSASSTHLSFSSCSVL